MKTHFPNYRQDVTPPRIQPRRGVVLAVVLAGMVLLLLMLGGLARRVMIEHRAIDAQAQSLQADWLLWSAMNRAENRAEYQARNQDSTPPDWNFIPSDPGMGKLVTARVLELAAPADEPQSSRQIELRWTTPSGIIVERSGILEIQANSSKEGSP